MELRCSKLARPMVCAGSLHFTDLPDEQESAPAKEGTAAGEWLRILLERRLAGGAPAPSHASNGVPFDHDMKFYTEPIAEEILSLADDQVVCERRIDWQTRSGIWIRGQPDASFTKDGNLYIDDLKYGWRLVEHPSWQLIGYAIGEIMIRQQVFPKIFLRIRQPRPHHEDGDCRVMELTYEELLAYKEQIEERCHELEGGLDTLATGPQCRNCNAAVACPAFSKSFFSGIEYIHEFIQDHITDQELSRQLDLLNRVSEMMKIKKDSIEALAIDRIKSGKIIPGYLTESKYGDRKWISGISPKTIKTLTGIDIVKEEMLSPAQAEKAGVPKTLVKGLVERHFLGQKLKKGDANKIGSKIFGNEAPKQIGEAHV